MKRRDALSAAGLAVLACGYLVANRRYPLDTLATPGPGVFPLGVGALMLGLAACQAVIAMRSARGGASTPIEPAGEAGPARGHVLALVVVLVGYAVAVGLVGFLTASFAVVLVSSRLLGTRDWLTPTALALGVTAAAYAIFVAWLGVPFPAGLLR